MVQDNSILTLVMEVKQTNWQNKTEEHREKFATKLKLKHGHSMDSGAF